MTLYYTRQDISLRGHRNEKLQISNDNHSVSNSSTDIEDYRNQGNFLELVKMLSLENNIFESNLMLLPKNTKYKSNLIQNDILEAAAIVVGRAIVNEIKNGSDIVSIIADESRDIDKEEQMNTCIKYLCFRFYKKRTFLRFCFIEGP